MTPKPVVLVFLLVTLIVTLQFEWKQPLVSEAEANPAISQRRQQILDKEEFLKEKIILSQEKNIQQLKELVQSVQRQLLHCRGSNNTVHGSGNQLTENVNDIQWQQILDE